MVLSSLALDLRRVALAYHRGSIMVGDRFLEEALKRKKEAESIMVKPYIKHLLSLVPDIDRHKAEDALMYSVLFQNAALTL